MIPLPTYEADPEVKNWKVVFSLTQEDGTEPPEFVYLKTISFDVKEVQFIFIDDNESDEIFNLVLTAREE